MYRIMVPTAQDVAEGALPAAVEASLKTLRQYGYSTTFQNGPTCQITVSINDEKALKIEERLTPNVVKTLSRFTERVSVQNALNDMFARMVGIGWGVTIKNATILIDERIEVEHPDGTTKAYALTNAEMVRLRHDLDHAETHWIIGDKMPLFLKVGWEVQEGKEGGYYILYKPEGGFETVTFGRVNQAKAAVKSAEEALTTMEAKARADKIADELGIA